MPKNFGPITSKFSGFLHGGDYNPEQWLNYPGILEEDMRLLHLAHCNSLSVGIFSWVSYEPEEGKYNFGWMDRVMDMLAANGAYAVLATPSGGKPAWMSRKYPEIRRVNREGRREPHYHRHNHCYTSPVYRRKVSEINRLLAERYGKHPALLAWHISNEYGGECHCDLCYAAFREWLRRKYRTLDALNEAWWARFWSHTFTEWEQIEYVDDSIHAMVIDWKRFITDQTCDFIRNETAPLRELTPEVPATTNMMGFFPQLDYWKVAECLDVISWDSYPNWHGPCADWELAADRAMAHDLFRTLKGGKPFMLMESTPSNTNWQEIGRNKRPGVHLLSSLQAVAHGSDTVQYFQWRKSRGSFEKFHGAVVDHVGHEHTREFRGVAEVGALLEKLGPVVGTSVEAEVALVYDWENSWGIGNARGPRNRDKLYQETCATHYREFWKRGIPVDVINEEQDLSRYKLVVAPMLYMVRDGVGEAVENFVRGGGAFVATYLSGIVDGTDLCFLGGFPGPLRRTLGLWVEETDCFWEHQRQDVAAVAGNPLGLAGEYAVRHYADVIHPEGAQTLAVYAGDFYAGQPAVTVNALGRGEAYYVASRNDERFMSDFLGALAGKLRLRRALPAELPLGVTAQIREDERNSFVFLLNFNPEPRAVELGRENFTDMGSGRKLTGRLELPGYGALVLQRG